jgi:hypothetical protein
MPQYRVRRIEDRGMEESGIFQPDDTLIDDVIISPDLKRLKMITAYDHRIIDEPLENFKKIEFYKNDSSARQFSSFNSGETAQPVLWKKFKDIEQK